MSTATQNQTKELFVLWKTKSKDGKLTYFTGKTTNETKLIGFYNTNKKNPEEPDLRVYILDEDNTKRIEYASLWCKLSKANNKYLSGQTKDKMYITGFFNNTKNEKQPYIRVYLQDELHPKKEVKEEPKQAENPFNQFKTTNTDPLF